MANIKKLYDKLEIESFVCHWHKMDIIMYYCDWHIKERRIQDFTYSFDVSGQKCQIENCPQKAEVKLVKKLPITIKYKFI